MTMTKPTIPSVDLSPFFMEEGVVVGDAATAAQRACARAINCACREHGFLHVRGFGVSSELYQRSFDALEQLFDSPSNIDNCRPWHPSHNMGYSPHQTESTNPHRPPELKEAFNVRFPPAHENDYRGFPDAYIAVAKELQIAFQTATNHYALACALALGLPLNFFASKIQDMDLCTIRFLHYPPCDFHTTSLETTKPIRVGKHTDFGAFTFLLLGAHGAEGLQIKPVDGGQAHHDGDESGWINVEVPPSPTICQTTTGGGGGAIVNTGALMARWINDEWRATAHRVIVPSSLEASHNRYSIAVFLDPDTKALMTVHDQFVSPSRPRRYEPITGWSFLQMKLEEMANPTKL
jgi:isopenicillin N synthase-like dioxygenase